MNATIGPKKECSFGFKKFCHKIEGSIQDLPMDQTMDQSMDETLQPPIVSPQQHVMDDVLDECECRSLESTSIDTSLDSDDEDDCHLNCQSVCGAEDTAVEGVSSQMTVRWADEDDEQMSDQSSPHSSQHSSGYCSLSTTCDDQLVRKDVNAVNATVADNTTDDCDGWDCEVFDPKKPYMNEPLAYPSSQRIHTPVEFFKHFVPHKDHPKRIGRPDRKHWTVDEGQFDSD